MSIYVYHGIMKYSISEVYYKGKGDIIRYDYKGNISVYHDHILKQIDNITQ